MKEILKRSIAVFVIMLMLINSSLLLVVSSAVEAIGNAIDESKINSIYEMNLEKYVNYKVKDNTGVLVQANIKTGIEYGEGQEYKAIKSTEIVLNSPKIEGEYPEKVEVIGISTKATNGSDSAKDFTYAYEEKTGEIKIEAKNNADEKGKIYSEKVDNARDEYRVICYYGEKAYKETNEKRELEFKGTIEENIANDENTKIEKEIEQKYEVAENISGIVSTKEEAGEIYNGYIKANGENGTSNRTEYKEVEKIEVSYKDIAEEIEIKSRNSFVNSKEKEEETEEVVYKSTKINKNEILSKLGEEGKIQIQNTKGEVLGEVNKDTEADENGNVEITYEEMSEIVVKISKPVELGEIAIENTKQIKESMTNIDNKKIKVTDEITCVDNEKKIDEETKEEKEEKQEVYKTTNSNEEEIKEAETKIDLGLDKTELTNNIQNEVTFMATLITNDARYNLYKNPVIEIKLPSEVEKVILGDASLLYDNNLSIKNIEVVEKEGRKVIRVEVSGTQNAYLYNSLVSGPEIIIPATVIIKKDIKSVDTNIEYTYTNETGTKAGSQLGVSIKSVTDVEEETAEESIVGATPATYSVTNDNITTEIKATLGDKELKDGDTVHEHEYIQYSIKLKNNSDHDVENINVVGNVPDGTTYVKDSYGDFNYDENDKYVLKEDSTVKEYNQTISLKAGEEKSLTYYVRANSLPEGQTSKDIEGNIVVSKNGNNISDYKLKNTVNKAEIQLKLNARETTREDNLWIYEITLKNNSGKELKNVSIDMNLQKEMKFSYIEDTVTEYTVDETNTGVRINVPVLENKSEAMKIQLFIKVTATDDNKIDYELSTVAIAKINNADTYYSNINKEIAHTFGLEVIQTSDKEGKELKYDEEVEYNFVISDISNKDIQKQITTLEIMNYADKSLVPLRAEYEYFEYNSQTNKYEKKTAVKDISKKYVPEGTDASMVKDLNLVLGLPKGEKINLKLVFKAGEIYQKAETSNCIKIAYDYCGTHTVTSNIIKNIVLPRYTEDNPVNPDVPVTPDNPDNPNNPDTPNTPDNPSNPDNPNTPSTTTYSVSGFVWEDTNKNGQYDNTESKLKDITVKLFNSDTNSIVKDKDGKNLETKTNESGEYKFENIAKGKYLVLFEYDNGNYALTTYKKNGVNEDKNSDVIKKTASIDGVKKTVAVTDILDVTNANISYINMGLVKNAEFDLSLNKSITKVTVKYGGNEKKYEYDKTKLAKVEIPAKQIAGATVTVEYEFDIKNEGNVDGYVDEIVDYIPEGYNFDSGINAGWSKSTNGTLKNIGLAGIIIKAGETKTVSLQLTKTLSANSTGKATNIAEILKSSSINGDKDIDSENGNKNESEDDYSKAELLVSVKTGAIVYMSIIIAILVAAVVILKILANKKIINMKHIKFFSAAILLVFTIFIGNKAYAGTAEEAYYEPYTMGEATSYATTYHRASGGPISCYFVRWVTTSSGDNCDWETTDHIEEAQYDKKGNLIKPRVEYIAHHKTVNYVHYQKAHGDGQLYCTDGNDMGEAPSTYTYSSVSVSVNNYTEYAKYNLASIVDNGSSPKFMGYSKDGNDSNYFMVGPYNVNYEGDIYGMEVFQRDQRTSMESTTGYEIVDANGNPTNITSGQNFYIKVSKNVTWISRVKIYVKRQSKLLYNISYRYHETWRTANAGYQVLGKDGNTDIITDENGGIDRESYNQVELPGIQLPLLQNLVIEKKDVNTGVNCFNAIIRIRGPYYYDKTFTMNLNQPFVLQNLPSIPWDSATNQPLNVDVGPYREYVVEEIGAPVGYNLHFQQVAAERGERGLTGNKVTITEQTNMQLFNVCIQQNQPYTLRLWNMGYGNLTITKQDVDSKLPLNEIGFKICRSPGIDNEKEYIKTYEEVNGDPSKVTYTSNPDEAMIFTTDSSGQIKLKNIPNITYKIEEVVLSKHWQHYYEVKTEEQRNQDNDVVSVQSSENKGAEITYKTITNKQLYVDLSGYVWEDIEDGKNSSRNDLYKNDEYDVNDKLIKDIPVTLKKADGTIVAKTYTDENGAYKFEGKVVDNENKNQYKADGKTLVEPNTPQIYISKLSEYYIEFEYNGLKYTNVAAKITSENGSKAVEIPEDRTNFNNSYASITGGNEKNGTTAGYSRNENGGVTNNLTYQDGGNYTSTLVQNTGYTTTSAKDSVSAQNGSVGVRMNADTRTAGYTAKWEAGVYEIKNINLGMYVREQPDMAIATDLYTVDLKINGYSHTYKYNERYELLNNRVDIFSEGVKYKAENSNYPTNYERQFYKNYAYASGITGNGALKEEDKLQFWTTYKITVKNQSTALEMAANELTNYCDNSFDLSSIESYYIDSTGNKVQVNWNQAGEKNGFYVIKTDSLKDTKIEGGKDLTVYLSMKKKLSKVIEWSNKDVIEEKTFNVTEITSYSTYKNGARYAGIDKDSAPDNITPGQGKEYVDRYEDDTDAAPVLTIKFDEPRTITGYVFEDYTDSALQSNKTREGDGKYNASQDGFVGNVKVELVKVSDNSVAYIYPKVVSEMNNEAEVAEKTTSEENKGYYEFVGIIPGEYYLKYTYGDGSVIYKTTGEKQNVTTQDYKSTIVTSKTIQNAFGAPKYNVTVNTRWYQDKQNVDSYSAAVDDWDLRQTINRALRKVEYQTKNEYDNKQDDAKLHTMVARTPDMSIAIENANNEETFENENRIARYDNIDFGIVERPRQSFEVNKEISHIKLKLANGQILAEGDPRTETIQYVTYLEHGSLKIEMDSEIIEGATVEITYDIKIANNSEIDYDTERYYKYGITDGATPVKTTINTIVDYLDEKLSTTYQYDANDGEWKYVNAETLRKYTDTEKNKDITRITDDVYNAIKIKHNILINNANVSIAPGENRIVTMNASKLLSTSEETTFDNHTELITVSNSVGRFYGEMSNGKWKSTIPGNYNIDNKDTSESDNNDYGRNRKAQLIIIPSTGQKRIYYALGIGCLLILVGGIVIIKKKVL